MLKQPAHHKAEDHTPVLLQQRVMPLHGRVLSSTKAAYKRFQAPSRCLSMVVFNAPVGRGQVAA